MILTDSKSLAALSIVKKLTESGHQALFAGGCVRDFLLGFAPADFDIATNATPDQVEKLFKKTIPVGKQFGVILVIIDGMQFEVATFRTEGGYQDGRHPGYIQFSGAEEDALRRDFTVNGLFYDPLNRKVLDYVGGQDDIQKKVIRCIGVPAKRFEEDKLRLLRAIRFSVRLDFQIEFNTWKELKRLASGISIVSMERIQDEITKILTSKRASTGLRLLAESGLWTALWPEINHNEILFARFDNLNPNIRLANAAFFFTCPKDDILKFMKRLRYSNDVIQRTMHILSLVDDLAGFPNLREGKFKRMFCDPDFLDAKALYSRSLDGANKISAIESAIKGWKLEDMTAKPLINGNDLRELGFNPGPKFGKVLEEAYLLQLEGELKDKVQALSWAKTQI